MKSFAIKLKEERIYNNFTQKKIAELLNIPLRAYQNYEAVGKNHREPSQDLLVKIAKILDASLDYLLNEEL
ncbi:MAG: helix-turn-helix domain-containing protein [Firmicutes bacterium]|nr:helix-turn-helix domain-containing protein [Bacillota bacterium]